MNPTLKRLLFLGGRRGLGVGLGATVVIVTALYAPAALAFPHRARIGATTIYSVAPIPPVMADRLNRADRLLAASPLFSPAKPRTVVLTDGGWRWRVMAAGSADAIALRRPFSNMLLFNHSDIARDRAWNDAPIGGVRSLSGTIAHEAVHLLTARRYGEVRLATIPRWKREGYADYIAQETSLGRDDERRLRATRPQAPVLAYYQARRRVAAELARNGHSVDRLLRSD